jgi:hypothetical protein
MSTPPDRERIAKNFVRRYGEDRLRELIDRLSVGESGQQIAESFGVSREAVRKWKNTFGNIVTYYSVHPEVQRFMDRAQSDEGDASVPATSSGPMIEIVLDSSS